MKVGVLTNKNKKNSDVIEKKIIDILISKEIDFCIINDFSEKYKKDIDYSFFQKVELPYQLDAIIIIGGDGTILRAAYFCAKNNIPILGINLGIKGFLSELKPQELDCIPRMLLDKSYINYDKRFFLELRYKDNTYYALNDVVIRRYRHMLSLNLKINEEYVDCYHCDGFIVSSPTGSTAYSLSAGGPILLPNTNAIVLTPLSSHSLYARPIVVNADAIIQLYTKVEENNNKKYVLADVFCDGWITPRNTEEKNLQIRVSMKKIFVSFLRRKSSNYFDNLHEKMLGTL